MAPVDILSELAAGRGLDDTSAMLTPDRAGMAAAIALAQYAEAREGEAPFGCVIVDEHGLLLALGAGSATRADPLRHSEMAAIRRACARRAGLLEGCTLYSTHEPCPMCCGAICHAKLSRVVWGSARSDLPALFKAKRYTAYQLLRNTSRPPTVVMGVLNAECIALFGETKVLI